MAYPPARVLFLAVLSALSVACGHKIGDECKTSVDCSQGGERLCDITQPGGYCTVFNCEPGTCPEEAACIAYGASLSIAPACRDPNQLSRIERAFCMLNCSSNSDCRSGYVCVDLNDERNAWRNALPIDRGRSSKVCVTSATAPDPEPTMSTEVCTASASASSGGSSSGGSSSSGGTSSGGANSGGSSGAGGDGGGTSGAGGDGG
jgi:hypothetical protein